jgi:hypothetical protein
VVQRAESNSANSSWWLEAEDDGSESWDDDDTPVNTVSPEEEKKQREIAVTAFVWNNFPAERNGFVKIGVHETTNEKAASLVIHGPSLGRVGSGHGSGKGGGFYVTPVKGQLGTAVASIAYGECFVAIYIAKAAKRRATNSSTVDEAEELYANPDEPSQACYYVMGAGGEIVIPTRCFALVRVAATPADCNNFH